MAKFAINASGAMLLLSLVQVLESISGSVVPLAMFRQQYSQFWTDLKVVPRDSLSEMDKEERCPDHLYYESIQNMYKCFVLRVSPLS